ncbi:MAG TPA: Gfo/Idh/MocA family oxidoreductase [Longimicrobiales bacterium]|nr:Gfo/Idh/MocA family oxidoreductase [Longimicrobiales bacterium]
MSAPRLGVVGVGSLGYHHARILSSMPEVQFSGVHDTSPARLEEVAEKLGVATETSLDALLDGSDAVVVAVPTTAHEAVAMAAIERGVHILIEKPIAPTLAAADRIVNAADAANVIVQIGHVERFNAALRACEPYLEAPLFVESHRLAPFNPRGTDVAVVLDLMIHDLDLVLSLMKRPVSAVAAVGVPVLTPSVDIANARLEFEGGGVANLTASRISLERMRKIRFFQKSGYISLDLAAGTGEFLRLKPGMAEQLGALMMAGAAPARAGAAPDPAGAGPGVRAGVGTGAAMAAGFGIQDLVERISLAGDGGEPLAHELASFVAAVRGDAPVPVSGHDGRQALAVALDIVERMRAHVAH